MVTAAAAVAPRARDVYNTEIKRVRCERVTGDELAQNLMILDLSQEGLKLTCLELGVLYARYIKLMNLSAEELGSRINKTGQHVRDILAVNASASQPETTHCWRCYRLEPCAQALSRQQ